MLGIEIVKNKESREIAPKETLKIMELCKERGLLVGKGGMAGNIIRIKPPLCISDNDSLFIINTLDEVIEQIGKF